MIVVPPKEEVESFALPRAEHKHTTRSLPFHEEHGSLRIKVGSCDYWFGARSAFTHVTACTLAESPSDPLHRRLRQLRCVHCRCDFLPGGANQSPGGSSTR
jgi:hypothetical protein